MKKIKILIFVLISCLILSISGSCISDNIPVECLGITKTGYEELTINQDLNLEKITIKYMNDSINDNFTKNYELKINNPDKNIRLNILFTSEKYFVDGVFGKYYPQLNTIHIYTKNIYDLLKNKSILASINENTYRTLLHELSHYIDTEFSFSNYTKSFKLPELRTDDIDKVIYESIDSSMGWGDRPFTYGIFFQLNLNKTLAEDSIYTDKEKYDEVVARLSAMCAEKTSYNTMSYNSTNRYSFCDLFDLEFSNNDSKIMTDVVNEIIKSYIYTEYEEYRIINPDIDYCVMYSQGKITELLYDIGYGLAYFLDFTIYPFIGFIIAFAIILSIIEIIRIITRIIKKFK